MVIKTDAEEDGLEMSYEYSSSDIQESLSSDILEYEKEYFAESMSESSDEKEAGAWEDSDDDEKLRKSYHGTASWLGEKKVRKQIEIQKKKLKFGYERHVFSCQCRIKLAKAHDDYLVLVDAYNSIYILKNFEICKVLRIEMFGASDFVFVEGGVLFSSLKYGGFKEVAFTGEVKDIKVRTTECIRKMISVDDGIYVIGEQIVLLNNNYGIVEQFDGRFRDVAVSTDALYCLGFNGDVVVMTRDLRPITKMNFEYKFDFKSIYFVNGKVVVGMSLGVKIFDRHMNLLNEAMNMKDEITGCIEYDGYILYGSDYSNSLKIVLPDLRSFDGFPFNSIRVSPMKALVSDGKSIIICYRKAVDVLRMKVE
ncbi:hypothetical protein CWI42_090320 [Ordospora colligata]|uniref:Uncharacterized protein n=1 Tax=Ordospora colligata OC4 TaxID=1354746 RepID=A0A0B2UIC0_9MICR|nr:uncharacterized protein M896_090320 [Ordospora colligata OC4]KHN69108.1 hypothetical protein M896_090320 [Ordospora colligata OC4]TBU14563.1 hypothetical protein CWI41_090320 [Ordospora colligata]TBU18191.1 hypothetical protein CWI42_090320 [Ordospora colligata]